MSALRHILALLATTLALAAALPAHAQAPAPTGFGAEPPTPKPAEVAPGDFEGMLKNCDIIAKDTKRKLDACKQDATGVDFLAAAYLALWAILMVFFILVRQRQKKLVLEMQSLRERLARLTDER